jgi:hypothetical protein
MKDFLADLIILFVVGGIGYLILEASVKLKGGF